MDKNTENILESPEFLKENMVTKGEMEAGFSELRADMETEFWNFVLRISQ